MRLFTSVALLLFAVSHIRAEDDDRGPVELGAASEAHSPAEGGHSPAVESDSRSQPLSKDDWIERLESRKYATRREATIELYRRGLSVLDIVQEITLRGPSEASDRAMEVLKQHHLGSDPTLRAAADEKLRAIADSEGHPKANAAEMALRPEPGESDTVAGLRIPNFQIQRNLPIRFGNGARIRNRPLMPPVLPQLPGGNIVPIQAMQNAKRISVRTVNGKRDVTVQENGKSVRIIDLGKGIRVEKVDANGNKTIREYKDVAALKRQDAKSHQVFTQTGKAGNQVRINVRREIGEAPTRAVEPHADEIRRKIQAAKKRHEETLQQHRQQHEEMFQRARRRTKPGIKEVEAPEAKENAPSGSKGADPQLDDLFGQSFDFDRWRASERVLVARALNFHDRDCRPAPMRCDQASASWSCASASGMFS